MTELARCQIAGLDVSRETFAALERFEGLVRRWNSTINLVSKASILELRSRHVIDSAQLMSLCPEAAGHWVDLGSGGGFPGVVIAILAKELHPGLRVSLVESDVRKAIFLRQAVKELELPASVIGQRIESVAGLDADVLSARALAPLDQLLSYADRHLRQGGIALLPKGAQHQGELVAARKRWRFCCESQPSLSDPRAAILVIRNIHRAEQ